MSLKVSFNGLTYKLHQSPNTLESLIKLINENFTAFKLPQSWHIYYVDSDNDKVMIFTEDAFQCFLKDMPTLKKPTKLYIEETSVGTVEKNEKSVLINITPTVNEEEKEKEMKNTTKMSENTKISNKDETSVNTEEQNKDELLPQAQKKDIPPFQRVINITRRLLTGQYKDEKEKSELEKRLQKFESLVTSEEEKCTIKTQIDKIKQDLNSTVSNMFNLRKKLFGLENDSNRDQKQYENVKSKYEQKIAKMFKKQVEKIQGMFESFVEAYKKQASERLQRVIHINKCIIQNKATPQQLQNLEKFKKLLTKEQEQQVEEEIAQFKKSFEEEQKKLVEKRSQNLFNIKKLMFLGQAKPEQIQNHEKLLKVLNEQLIHEIEQKIETFKAEHREKQIAKAVELQKLNIKNKLNDVQQKTLKSLLDKFDNDTMEEFHKRFIDDDQIIIESDNEENSQKKAEEDDVVIEKQGLSDEEVILYKGQQFKPNKSQLISGLKNILNNLDENDKWIVNKLTEGKLSQLLNILEQEQKVKSKNEEAVQLKKQQQQNAKKNAQKASPKMPKQVVSITQKKN